jgi:hypothetical protein
MSRTKKDRSLDPRLERTITALRIAGMPERNTYESLQRNLKNAPSYRDVRAAYTRAGVTTRHEATLRRKSGEFIQTGDSRPIKQTHYREALERERDAPYADASSRAFGRRFLDDQYVIGYGYRNGLNADDLSDAAPILDAFEKVESSEGS